MKNKFRYETFKVLDYPREKVPINIIHYVLPTYKDRDEELSEDLFSTSDFEEYVIQKGDDLTIKEDKFIKEITAIMAKLDVFYVRFLK